MTTTTRQNNLILNEDWTRIYQTFKNADFKSYDFENLRRVIITYLRENYPEDFNDYIESSEYMALIDAVAFLGQSLAFRVDLASRENFIELAERRESVLRIARMLSYNAKRNIPSTGLLKFTTVTTTEEILDSNGRNLAQQIVSWNDPTNPNWAEQFILVLNSAMSNNTEFGRSQGSAVIQGIPTDQYRFRTTSFDVPIYSFSKTVAGRNMVFELVSTAFKDSEEIYEEPPVPGNQLGFIYRNDSRGPASPNTGFFLLFKQGSLELADFGIGVPTTNERIAVDSVNINNNDVWLYSLNSIGLQQDLWTQVSNLVGNNIAYNSISQNIRNIYAVQTRENDRIDLVFADGIYGNLPQGAFRVYYRVSNGLSYVIAPNEMRGINISIPYVNSRGIEHTLTVGLALQYTVANSAATESLDSIRQNAPAAYYTQNRMITGEDYNLAPLTSSQDILKVKSINRTSSGISRNFEIIDASGKYSSVNVFADDGFIYKEDTERILNFKFKSRIDILNFLRRNVEPAISSTGLYNFYITKFTEFDKKSLEGANIYWNSVTTGTNQSTGYFKKTGFTDIEIVGSRAGNNLKYITPGALVKFVPPLGKAFKGNQIVDRNDLDPEQRTKIWAKVVRVVGDGTNNNTGILPSGEGPIFLNEIVPGNDALIEYVIPKFVIDLPVPIETEMTNQIFQNRNFGLRYDSDASTWKIITSSNLNLVSDFSLEKSGDSTNNNLDASWLVSFVKDVDQYVVTIRTLDYVFGSTEQNRFYFDANEKSYNKSTGLVGKDLVKVLDVNTSPNTSFPLGRILSFEIDDTVKFDDGYESTKEIKIAFSDRDSDGVIDDPECFNDIVGGPEVNDYIFFKEITLGDGSTEYQLSTEDFIIERREADVNINNPKYADGSLIYFFDTNENRVKRVNKSTNTLVLASEYKGVKGRKNIKFQYIHNASIDRRIDPSVSNIIDIFLLTRSYDREFREYLIGARTSQPVAPTSESLRISFGSKLGAIKAISDEIIYHPVKYKVLFGATAEDKLRAQFKVVKNPNRAINDNDLKVRIVSAINDFFDVSNWDFGDRFYLGELITYIVNSVAPDISNLVILPRQPNQVFGSLFEIQSNADEIFVSGATVDDIEIVTAINAAEVRADPATIVNVT
jgi:hypothetical protein